VNQDWGRGRAATSGSAASAEAHLGEEHLANFVGPEPDALVFTAPRGGPLARSLFSRRIWRPAVNRAGIPSITFHGLRHSFVAILVAAGCNVREVSERAGHNSVAFTLTRYGGLFEDGTEAAVDRLDALLGGAPKDSDNVLQLEPRKLEVSPERVPGPILTARRGSTEALRRTI
jgi:hypothetical protein